MRNGWIAVAALLVAWMTTPASVSAQETPKEKAEAHGEAEPMEGIADDAGDPATRGSAEQKAAGVTRGRPGESTVPRTGTVATRPEPTSEPYALPRTGMRATREKGEDILPLKFHLHGYYRARYNWIQNTPLSSPGGFPPPAGTKQNAQDTNYGYMRLRLEPEVVYGPNPDLPIARLQVTIDGFDNVVFGDNARVFNVPLFSVDQSVTTVDGTDLRDTLKLERAWIEFLVPVGQMRVGRMESHFGVGLLTHAGNDLAEWGDFLQGETFDRILFVTRPMTVARGISKGDTRKTPLIYAFAYDRLSQDPVVDSTIRAANVGGPAASDYQFRPFFTTFPERSTFPLEYLAGKNRVTNEIINVLAWFDEEFGNSPSDELFAGTYIVYRWQDSTNSKITIIDAAWRMQYTLDASRLALATEGEFTGILGHSGALALTGGCPPAPCNRGTAGIYNLLGRFGVRDPGNWEAMLEGGWASGDDNLLFNNKLTTRAYNTNVKVGLLMYQVALKSLSFDALAPLGAAELGANGSVWNSKYFWPSGRFTIVNGLEVHGAFLLGWGHKLAPEVYGQKVSNCGFKKKCFYGWEADLALRARMGKNDIVWIDLESAVMQPGKAFTTAGLQDKFLWTIQLRSAMIF